MSNDNVDDPGLAEWSDNRPTSMSAKIGRWRRRWRSGVVRGTEQVLGSRNSWEWLVSDFVAVSHLPSVRGSISSVRMVEPGQTLADRLMPPDTDLPDPTPIRLPVFATELTKVRCHVESGLVQLPSGHLFLGSDGALRLGLMAGGAAQEMSELRRAGRHLNGTWAMSAATSYYYHHIVDNCVPLLKALRLAPGLRVAAPADQAGWYYDALTTLGIDWQVVPEKVVTIDHLVTVDRATIVASDVTLLREAGAPNTVAGDDIDVLFVSRRGLPRFDEATETRVLSALGSRHVTSIDPSAMTMSEQIHAFASARAVVSSHGGALTNLVWAQRAAVAVEVFARGFRGLEFSRIAQAAGVDYVPCTDADLAPLSRALEALPPLPTSTTRQDQGFGPESPSSST